MRIRWQAPFKGAGDVALLTTEPSNIMQSNASKTVAKSGKFSHLAFCSLPLLVFVLLALGLLGRGYWILLPILFLQVAAPLLDLLTGCQDDVQYEKNDFSSAQTSLLHWNPRLYALLYMGSVVYVAMSLDRFTPIETGLLVAAF